MQSIGKSIGRRIRGKGRGGCFTPKAFLDLGSPEAVRITLHRMEKDGTIRRLVRGLYDFPKRHPTIGFLSPSPDEVARALSASESSRLQPSGAYAANLLGLSEQVPARIVFLTDGRSRRIRIGHQEIILKKTTTRNMTTSDRISGTIIQALRHLGATQISKQHIAHLRQTLPASKKALLKRDGVYAPGWMHRIIDAIAEDSHA